MKCLDIAHFPFANGIKPVVDKVLPFTEARAALELMKGQGHFGKIALSF